MPSPVDQQVFGLIVLIAICLAVNYRRRWRGSGNAHGTSRWASEADLEKSNFFSGKGLILGRTPRRGKLIRIPRYQHVSVFAATGAGKGVSFVIPTLLDYRRGSVFVFDPKGELFFTTSAARQRIGQQIVRIDPFGVCGPGGNSFNPFSCLPRDGSMLIDEARAMAEAMIVRPPEGDKDPHWNNSAAMFLTVAMTATLLFMKADERNLSTVREMMTDPTILKEVVSRLQSMGGIAARLANQLGMQTESEKEIASVISTANTHCSFLDSESVAAVVNESSFSADVMLNPGTTVYFVLPVEQLAAQRGFLRLIASTFIRHIMRHGVKNGGETLFLLDECASLSGLDALEQAFILGRGKGIRLYTFWQTVDQARAAFQKTPNLVSDNSDTQIYFGINSYATAELVSKTLGTWTMVTTTANEGDSGGTSYSDSTQQGTSRSTGWSRGINYAEHARPLLNPSEIIQLSGEYLIAFVKGCPPILARRLKYYSDRLFRPVKKASSTLWWLLVIVAIGLVLWGLK